MPPRPWPREVRSRLRVLGRPAAFFAQLDSRTSAVRPKGSTSASVSEALVGGDCRRTARATTADYLLWRAKGVARACHLTTGNPLWGRPALFFDQHDLVHPPSSEGQHKCERSEALVGGDSRRTARATTADYLLRRAKGAALSFATGRRAIPSGGDQPLFRVVVAYTHELVKWSSY